MKKTDIARSEMKKVNVLVVVIVPNVVEKMKNFDGIILATRDTHYDDYMDTQEGKKLPVPHCIKGTDGWNLRPEIEELLQEPVIDKPTFGSRRLAEMLWTHHVQEQIESVTLVGLCTDICVISNAMIIKAFLPDVPIIVDSSCCAGVTPKSHQTALDAMKVCQIEIV